MKFSPQDLRQCGGGNPNRDQYSMMKDSMVLLKWVKTIRKLQKLVVGCAELAEQAERSQGGFQKKGDSQLVLEGPSVATR